VGRRLPAAAVAAAPVPDGPALLFGTLRGFAPVRQPETPTVNERDSPMDAMRKSARRAPVTACALALLLTALILGEAAAGNCTAPKQEHGEVTKNQIRIRNETLRDIVVDFYGTKESEAQRKATEIVKPGKLTQYNVGLGGKNGDVVGIARISINGTEVLKCAASVSNIYSKKSTEQVTNWSWGSCARLAGAGSACLSCYTDCNKTIKRKVRENDWQTTFIIKN
jgi:hypothetical protein